MNGSIEFQNITKQYTADLIAVQSFNLSIEPGEFVTLLGASGCGKTTCLRMVAGFVQPSSGRIMIHGKDVTKLPPHMRNTGMVFQSYALFPHKTVYQNIIFGLKQRKIEDAEARKRTRQALSMIAMSEFAERYPRQLSGGQQQRVALARAIVVEPEVLLLDEPLAALDLKLREGLQSEIRAIQRALGITTLFVTHDQGEALRMSDKVAVMSKGQLLQIDTPENIYERPNCRYVAQFVGKTNFFDVFVERRDENGNYFVRFSDKSIKKVSLEQRCSIEDGQRVILGVRPEHIKIGSEFDNCIRGRIETREYNGDSWIMTISDSHKNNILVTAPSGPEVPNVGDMVQIGWPATRGILIPTEGSEPMVTSPEVVDDSKLSGEKIDAGSDKCSRYLRPEKWIPYS